MLREKTPQKMNARLLLVSLVAVTVGLSMAWVSIGKFALFVFGAAFLVWQYFIAPIQKRENYLKAPHHTAHAILLALSVFALSLLWTTADTADSLGELKLHAQLQR
jgi:glucan phosphoethanolaminetransferase (alkaline phosphatase superfamily)